MGGYAWVTLATNDAYSLGALVLAHSLRRVGTKHELAVLITPGVTQTMREKLSAVFSAVMEVNVLDSKDEANLALLARPELGVTFTKLHCWRLTQYEKCVFLDADTLVVRNCDELFEREELSAAPDVGWPDCFNSGVFVYKPSQQTFASITAFAAAKGSFDGGDQGLLNMYFSDWARKDISKHLPFIYNMCSTAAYSYLPAFKQFGDDVRIIHFIGITKPWLQYFDTLTGIVQPPMESAHLQPLLQLWWNIFCEKVHPQLSPVMAGLAGALAQMTLGEPRSAEQIALEEHMRKQSWEQGHIDYMGRDSFDNIWKKICQTLALAPPRLPSPPKELQASEETDTFKTEKPLTPSIAAQSVESVDEVDKETAQTTTSHTEEQSLVNNVPITNVPKLLEKNAEVIEITSPVKESTGTAQEPFADTRKDTLDPSINPLSMNTLTSLEDVPKLSSSSILEEIPQQIALPRASSNLVQPLSVVKQKTVTSAEKVKTEKKNIETPEVIVDIKETMQPDIQDEKHAKELLTASEILTVNPVPIQVAESVLQLEPKESVLDAQISQEIISSTVTPVHLTEAKKKIHMNGSTSTSTDAVGKLNKLTTQPVESSQTSLPTDQTQPQLTLVLDTSVPESKETETCLRENLQSKTQATLKCENTKSTPSSIEAPTRPSRAKESVTSSPSVAKTAQQEKTVKRTVKKVVEKPEGEPSETTDGDSSGKKETKKVVKKVTKKPKTKSDEGLDDGAEDNSLVSKQKKTVKVVKKGTKSSQTTATDTAASEIPSASTSDAPIPPKRKTKPTVAKTVTKKSDIAQ